MHYITWVNYKHRYLYPNKVSTHNRAVLSVVYGNINELSPLCGKPAGIVNFILD